MDKFKREKIIERIEKLLNLAGNNPSEHEAVASALKAQELMAKYDIDKMEIGNEVIEEEIKNNSCFVGTGKKWRYQLAGIVARNFKCKCWRNGTISVVFYGYKTDALIAKQVFLYLFQTGNKLANKYVYQKKKQLANNIYGKSTKGCYNSYVEGFMTGISEKLEKQSTELMIITPKKVNEEFEKYATKFVNKDITLTISRMDKVAFEEGRNEGKNIMSAREIERHY